jgi:hypothetical protein
MRFPIEMGNAGKSDVEQSPRTPISVSGDAFNGTSSSFALGGCMCLETHEWNLTSELDNLCANHLTA